MFSTIQVSLVLTAQIGGGLKSAVFFLVALNSRTIEYQKNLGRQKLKNLSAFFHIYIANRLKYNGWLFL